MSRIAGAARAAPGVAGCVLARLEREGWRSATASAGPVELGWTGLRSPQLVEAEGGVLVAMDGRVYNRAELGFGSSSDAAGIAALYRRFGVADALARVNGDFALALYDPGDDSLWLARDRFGVKPLYYTHHGSGLAFASQPGALLGLPGVTDELDRRFVAVFAGSHYRYFDNEPARSPFADVDQVPAAHLLRFRDGDVSVSRWWSLADEAEEEGSEAELADRYRELLLDAVGVRVAAADRPAFTLSGGMDSSSVLGCAVVRTGSRGHAFSTVYADPTYDEAEEIRPMVASAVAQWHTVAVGDPDVFGLAESLVAVHDEPVATATWLSHQLLATQARGEGFAGLFGGLGGDELNAGEYEYFLFHFADLRAAGRDAELAHEVELWARHHDHPVYRKNAAVAEAALVRVADLTTPGRCLPDRARLERYANALAPDFYDLHAYEPVVENPFQSYLKNRAYQDMTRETLPCCLRAEDRQSTALGLENFLPFLDHRLVELMFRVPGSLKIRDGVTKRLLREAMRGVLPEATRTRVKKTGWNAPAHVWFAGSGRERLLDLIRSRSFRSRGIYDAAVVERIANEHDAIVRSGEPRENHMMFLWQLVNLELWLRDLDRRRAGGWRNAA